jgi:hypothetical protein
MKLNKMIKTILTLVLFLAVSTAFAQPIEEPDPDGSGDSGNPPLDPAPIGDYMIPMLVLGIATAFVLLRKKTTTQVS